MGKGEDNPCQGTDYVKDRTFQSIQKLTEHIFLFPASILVD